MVEGWTAAGSWQAAPSIVSRPFPANLWCPCCRHWQVQLSGIQQCRRSQPTFQPKCSGYKNPTKSIYVALKCFIILSNCLRWTVKFIISLVCVPPLFLPVSPTIAGLGPDNSAEEVTVTLSSPTSLVCEVQSYPPALITWLKDGTPFVSSRNIRVLPGLKSHVHDIGTEINKLEYNSKVHLFIIYHPCFHRWENSADPQC